LGQGKGRSLRRAPFVPICVWRRSRRVQDGLVLAASRVRRWWRCSRTSRQAAARTAQAPGVIAQRQVGRPSPVTGGSGVLSFSDARPGRNHSVKRQRPGCRGPGPLQTAEAGSGEPLPNTGLGGFIWVVPELPKGQTRQPSPGWFGERTFSDPYLADPVEPRPPGCQCDHPVPLELDAGESSRCLKCGLPSPRTVMPLLTDC
jgi:hypothetical protein